MVMAAGNIERDELISVDVTQPITRKQAGKPKRKKPRARKVETDKGVVERPKKKKPKTIKRRNSPVFDLLEPTEKPAKEIAFGWSTFCYTIQLEFMQTWNGWLKLLELPIAYTFSLYLLNILRTRNDYHEIVRVYFPITSAVTVFVSVLLISYIISPKTVNGLKKSVFEFLFNGFACFTYLSALAFFIYQQKIRFTSTQAINVNKEASWIARHFHYGAGSAALLHAGDAILGMIQFILIHK